MCGYSIIGKPSLRLKQKLLCGVGLGMLLSIACSTALAQDSTSALSSATAATSAAAPTATALQSSPTTTLPAATTNTENNRKLPPCCQQVLSASRDNSNSPRNMRISNCDDFDRAQQAAPELNFGSNGQAEITGGTTVSSTKTRTAADIGSMPCCQELDDLSTARLQRGLEYLAQSGQQLGTKVANPHAAITAAQQRAQALQQDLAAPATITPDNKSATKQPYVADYQLSTNLKHSH